MISLSRRCLVEALGTFALVAIGPGSVMVAAKTHAFGQLGIALAFGLAVTLIVAASGHLSGAHVNPAVTIGFWSVRRFPAREVIPYVVAQCAGAVAASLALGWLVGAVGDFGVTVPNVPLMQSFVIEMGYTGILGFVIMSAATDERVPRAVVPLAIGATVFAGALVTGPLTGGSFNPARSLGPAVASGIWRSHWLYWFAPVVGAVMGMRLFDLLKATPALETTGTEGVI